MRPTRLTVIVSLLAVCLAGCGKFGWNGSQDGSKSGGVAVIDLDQVAKSVGRDIQMVNALEHRQQSLNEQLQVVQASFVKQISERKEAAGEEPNEEQAKELVGMQREAGLRLNQVRKQALNNLSQHRIQLIASFREEVKPIAQKVAADKGLSIVVSKNDSVVFTYDNAVDITNDVVIAMKAQPQPAQKSISTPQSVGGDSLKKAGGNTLRPVPSSPARTEAQPSKQAGGSPAAE